ncbi:MAG: DUF1573 domain-containing protein [Bacteroidales bacterium]
MKHLYILLPVLFLFVGCSSNQGDKKNTSSPKNIDSLPTTTVSYDQKILDLGTITSGEIITNTFTFTNTGNNDLYIQDVQASCGCTATDYSKKPVKPGEKGYISVTFNTQNRQGKQSKTITVFANTKPHKATTLRFMAVIKSN